MATHANSTTAPEAERQPVVRELNGYVITDSRDVAVFFEKEHKHVLRDIRELIRKEPNLERSKFGPFTIQEVSDPNRGKLSHYEMDRDGFTLLAMGFTGEKALGWKLRYIEAFNAMEAELRARNAAPINYLDPKNILGFVGALQGEIAKKDGIIAELRPKAAAHDVIADSFGAVCRRIAAKNLQIAPQVLNRWMAENGWTYRIPNTTDDLAYQSKIAAGYLIHKVTTGPKADGTTWTSTNIHVTPKGMLALARAFPSSAKLI